MKRFLLLLAAVVTLGVAFLFLPVKEWFLASRQWVAALARDNLQLNAAGKRFLADRGRHTFNPTTRGWSLNELAPVIPPN